MKSFLNIVVNIFLPKSCYVCRKEGSYICSKCFKRKCEFNFFQKCHVCKKESHIGFVHRDCRESTYLDGLIYVTNYNDLVEKLIINGKYNLYFEIFNDLGKIMAEYFKLYNFSNPTLTYVPSFKRKIRERGFNQTKILAKKVSSETGKKCMRLLKRTRHTHSQLGLSEAERFRNLKGAFEINEKEFSYLDSASTIILIDDVYTTGSTLNECAKVIKERLNITVIGFAFARSRV
ncbi:MAG: hypothetical protein Q9M91_00885 [Candidatus Dojkabacteria bacterium]|nr:hypothetical protein [Candidatus Dojkabacteria bacterium]MDQ7020382.1 hypothetical protein [Candidatus Dojkabacteria bacterium]